MPISRQARMYHRLRDELLDKLGGKCVACGSTGGPERKLHIDHPKGRDWEPREVSSHMRMARYAEEHARGLVRLLCHDCNSSRRYNDRDVPDAPGDDGVPF